MITASFSFLTLCPVKFYFLHVLRIYFCSCGFLNLFVFFNSFVVPVGTRRGLGICQALLGRGH